MIDPLSIPIVRKALRSHRASLSDALGQRVARLNNGPMMSPDETAREAKYIATQARDLGILDAVCSLYGIIDTVETTKE